MTTARKRARKQPAEVRREEIIDAAVRVFARMSFRAAGTAEIAREAGVAEPTIYRHFDSKRELYLAALERTATMVIEGWRAIIDRTPNAAEALQGIGQWYGHHLEFNSDPLRLRHRAAAETEDEDVRAALRHGYLDIHRLVVEVVRHGQEQGFFSRDVTAEGAAWLFVGIGMVCDLVLLTGIPAAWQHEPDCPPPPGTEMDLAEMGAVFERGLSALYAQLATGADR